MWLFPRALPIVALKQSLTRELALSRADSFFRAHSLAPAGARTAVRFQGSDSLRTFVELAGGGHDSLNALIRGDDISPFAWSVRAFVPGNPREARVTFAPDGRIIGFERRLAEADRRPTISPDSGQRLAEQALDTWIDDRLDRWKLVTSSYETIKNSGRIDRTYTFERVDRRIAGAPLRAEVKIAGDTPSGVRRFVEIPESFRRRYAEMRSANDLLALLSGVGILAVVIVGIVALTRFARARRVRWREPIMVGAVIGVLALAAGINEMPGSWYWYDTAMSPATFRAGQVFVALFAGISTALLLVFTLAAAEAATRGAFPRHLDWWKLWRFRGTKEVAHQVGGGYAAAAMGFAYVTLFYLTTRTLFGWWVPSELLDDPNQIASPMPWVSAIAVSLNAGVWEESLFRALPLSLLSLWIGGRPNRRWWMAAGVVATALVFGFAHASYESWPPYSRGVELFLEACCVGGAVHQLRASRHGCRALRVRPGAVRDIRRVGQLHRIPRHGGAHSARAARSGTGCSMAVGAATRVYVSSGGSAVRGVDPSRRRGAGSTSLRETSRRVYPACAPTRVGDRRPRSRSSRWRGRPSPHSARHSQPTASACSRRRTRY